MKHLRNAYFSTALALALGVVLLACSRQESAGSGSVITNGMALEVVREDGAPAAYARVQMRPLDYRVGIDDVGSGYGDFLTDSAGRVLLPFPPGPAAVEIIDSTGDALLLAWQVLDADTAPESIVVREAVVLEGQLDLSSQNFNWTETRVVVAGSERSVGIDSLGRFRFPALPAGVHRIVWVHTPTGATVQTLPSETLLPGDTTRLYSRWEIALRENFAGAALNTALWFADTGTGGGGWGNGVLQTFTARPENLQIRDGEVALIAVREDWNGAAYTSASIRSKGLREFRYGRFEFSARLPAQAQGLWPQVLLMPSAMEYGPWPASGSIDLLVRDGADPDSIAVQVHTEQEGAPSFQRQGYAAPGLGSDFQRYALEWTPDSLLFYSGSARIFAAQGGAPFDRDFHLEIRLHVGGVVVGAPADSTLWPQEFTIRNLEVYRQRNLE